MPAKFSRQRGGLAAPAGGPAPLAWGTGPLAPGTIARPAQRRRSSGPKPAGGRACRSCGSPQAPARWRGCRLPRPARRATTGGRPDSLRPPASARSRPPRAALSAAAHRCDLQRSPDAASPPVPVRSRRPGTGRPAARPDAPSPLSVQRRRPGAALSAVACRGDLWPRPRRAVASRVSPSRRPGAALSAVACRGDLRPTPICARGHAGQPEAGGPVPRSARPARRGDLRPRPYAPVVTRVSPKPAAGCRAQPRQARRREIGWMSGAPHPAIRPERRAASTRRWM